MFAGQPDAATEAKRIVQHLTDYRGNKSHDRHIHAEECIGMGLVVEEIEKEGNETLQDLVLTVHHCYMHAVMNTGAFKIIENQLGTAFIKQVQLQQQIMLQPMMQALPQPAPAIVPQP